MKLLHLEVGQIAEDTGQTSLVPTYRVNELRMDSHESSEAKNSKAMNDKASQQHFTRKVTRHTAHV